MITIGIPEIKENRLCCQIDDNGRSVNVWFEVPDEYMKYLFYERCDAFVVGIINYAMRHGHDITCLAPITGELLYNISTYLIPTLADHDEAMYHTKIFADASQDDSPEINSGMGVGVGLSCGVDSFYTVLTHMNHPVRSLRLTHFVIHNVGAYLPEDPKRLKEYEHSRLAAKELGLPLIETNSNIHIAFEHENHLFNHTYAAAFATYCLKKLWSVFYYSSSGLDFSAFSVVDNSVHGSCSYDLLSLNCFSVSGLRFYSGGGAVTRIEKIRAIMTDPLVKKYLQPCYPNESGFPWCGACSKCAKTLLTLDALGALDDFAQRFDIDTYRIKRAWFLKYSRYLIKDRDDKFILDIYQTFKKELKYPKELCKEIDEALLDKHTSRLSKDIVLLQEALNTTNEKLDKANKSIELSSKIDSLQAESLEFSSTIDSLQAESLEFSSKIASLQAEINSLLNSNSWKITKPFRYLKKLFVK